ncbi:LuxR C-terminal-related transcriptional regulator [Kribbella sp. VKM Ac-2568]|uniref:LuxR C-terminal-related transcriptional regulator n=1 Tax=Kribbella sp. VKM Ac-2568 TaxID=2512219 RepID=UPI0010439959|nr:LuxR C-terminal-related transcriptional regulator [Kribbella sp. VKM Ac-2568]TCM44997.1 ATP/maltotriose-dependent transcriptional regulator MalT [Kribbella sp. VKM Ac-2568]
MTIFEPEHAHDGTRRPAMGGAPRPPLTLVSRERLRAALDRGSAAPLTMLVAPAGTGKTVLLSDWAAHRSTSGRSVLWVSGQDPDSLEDVLSQASAAAAPEPVVVDDAHLLSATMLTTLSTLLKKSPQSVRLLLATRYDLPLPLTELELRGLASTLRSRQLRFNDAEAAELIHAHDENATAADISLLQEKTAGWAAALVLAARTITVSRDAGTRMLSEQPVLDLLLGETFATLDTRTQSMLLSTFAANGLTAPLAAMLSADPNAEALLADLAGNGLLVTAYTNGADSEPVYRYHPLLIELLHRRAAGSPEDAKVVTAAHHRAALYYENRGEGSLALRNALDAGDPGLIDRVLLRYGPAVLASGGHELVAAGFENLPDGYLDTHRHLLGVRGILHRRSGDVTGAVMDTSSADQASINSASEPATPEDDALRADALTLRLWESRYGWYDVRDSLARARSLLVLDRTPDNGRRPAVLAPERLSLLLIELAATETWVGDLDEALRHLDEALVSARMAGHRQLIAGGLAHRAVVYYVRGQVENAAESARAALHEAGDRVLFKDYAVRAHVVLGLAALSQLDLAAARHWLEQVADTDVAASDTVVAGLRAILRASLLIENGQLDQAGTELATEPTAAGPLPSYLARDFALLRFWVAALIGDQGGMDKQLRILSEASCTAEADLIRAITSITDGDSQATLDAMDAALARPGVHPVLAASAASVRTVLLLRLGDEEAAETALVDMLNQTAPQRTLHALAPAGMEPAFVGLLRRHVEGPNVHPFAAVVLDKLTGYGAEWSKAGGVTLLGRTRPDGQVSPPRRLDAVINGAKIRLTAREADVLDELALGSSYTEIANALFITENTVKTHLGSLYRKLGVVRRSAALRVARNAGLT